MRIEVRSAKPKAPPLTFDIGYPANPNVDFDKLARQMLLTIREACDVPAQSVHYFEGDRTLGSWSLEREERTRQNLIA